MGQTLISGLNWTPQSDNRGFTDFNGPLYQNGGVADFLDGNDSLYGSFSDASGVALYNDASLYAGKGADTIRAASGSAEGMSVVEESYVSLGDGADWILASSTDASGLVLDSSEINAGYGNDRIYGESVYSEGVSLVDSTIELDDGNDVLVGESIFDDGLRVDASTIDGGKGNDLIGGFSRFGNVGINLEGRANETSGPDQYAVIDAGAGSDDVVGYGEAYGISADLATIYLGSGNDQLYADATNFGFGPSTTSATGLSLFDSSTLFGGTGNDCVESYARVDASGSDCQGNAIGAIAYGESLIDLGSGNDTLFGEAISNTDSSFSSNPLSTATGLGAAFNSTIAGGSGNDAFEGQAYASGEDSTATGISVAENSLFDAGTGNDLIVAYAQASTFANLFDNTALAEDVFVDATGVSVDSDSDLELGNGNDSIRAEAYAKNNSTLSQAEDTSAVGVYIGADSTLTGGNGKNSVTGIATAETTQGREVTATGIQVSDDSNDGTGTITLGNGIDTLIGTAKAVYTGAPSGGGEVTGILNNGGVIGLGSGNDVVLGTAEDGEDTGAIATGIKNGARNGDANFGQINLGDGNDKITGSGEDHGIWNDGVIDTGSGNDIVDARTGGFYETVDSARYDLGAGTDTVIGYGAGAGYNSGTVATTAITFNGGDGTDAVRLKAGTYTITDLTGGDWQIQDQAQLATNFILNDFEKFGGYSGVLSNLTAGTFVIV